VASKKKRAPDSIHDRDRIIVRLPDGMRDKLAALAEANGRSMTSEVVAAIEKHLKGTDRVTELWEVFEKHRENLEAIDLIWGAVEDLEHTVSKLTGDPPGLLTERRYARERQALEAAQQSVTGERAERSEALKGEVEAIRRQSRDLKQRIRAIGPEKQKDPPA
jgi:dsDNA-specific endonuclease/ATPase MutS2